MTLAAARHAAGAGDRVARFRVTVHVLAVADLPPTDAAATVAVSVVRRGWARPLLTSPVTPTSARRAVVRQQLRIEAFKLSLNPPRVAAGAAAGAGGDGADSADRKDGSDLSSDEGGRPPPVDGGGGTVWEASGDMVGGGGDEVKGLARSKWVSVGLIVCGVKVAQGVLDVGACVTALPSSPSATPNVVMVPLSNGAAVSVRVATCLLPPQRRFAAGQELAQEVATKGGGADATSPLSVHDHPTCAPLVEAWDEGGEAECLSDSSSSSAGIPAEFESVRLSDEGTAMSADVVTVPLPPSDQAATAAASRTAVARPPPPPQPPL